MTNAGRINNLCECHIYPFRCSVAHHNMSSFYGSDGWRRPSISNQQLAPEATDVSGSLNQINETLKEVVTQLDRINKALCELANAWSKRSKLYGPMDN